MPKAKPKKRLILFLAFLLFSGCAEPPLVKTRRACLGTIVEITVTDRDKPRQFIHNAIKKAFIEIERVEGLFSRFNPQSDISRINAASGARPTKVNAETIRLIEKSIEFARLTDGAFDITLENLGYRKIKIVKPEQSVFLVRPQMRLDLGGIAKGYAVDKAVAVLKQEGINCALVNAGGDIFALGERNRTEKWRVGVQHPRRKNTVLTILEVSNGAVATSGDYQKPGHIINPKSGYPCQDLPASVTVLAGDCLTADVLATSIFVLGPQKGMDLVNQLENTEAIVASVQENKLDILLSQGLKGKLVLKP